MEKEKKERTRREYAARGARSQKLMTFRCDLEVTEWLNQQPNKGRYINELIRKDAEAHHAICRREPKEGA